MFIAVVTFRDPFYVTMYIKPYKIDYIEDFITLNKNNSSVDNSKDIPNDHQILDHLLVTFMYSVLFMFHFH